MKNSLFAVLGVIATFKSMKVSNDNVTYSNAELFSTSDIEFVNNLLPAAALRLRDLNTIREAMVTLLTPENNLRRTSSETPVGFAFFFVVLAMVSLLIVLSVLLGWCFVVFNCIPKNPFFMFLHTLVWFVIIVVVLIIVTFSAQFPGWVILGAIYVLISLGITGAYFYYHCKASHQSASEFEMSPQK